MKEDILDKKTLLSLFIILLISFTCFLNALGGNFLYDDFSVVVNNPNVRDTLDFSRLFSTDFWGASLESERSSQSFRPFTSLSYRLNYFLSGLSPFYFRLSNVSLHVLCSLLVFFLYYRFVLKNIYFATLAALFFAVHAVHTDAVSNITGRADVLAGIFFLLAFFVYQQAREKNNLIGLFGAIILSYMAMLCKETGITVLGVCLLYELWVSDFGFFERLKSFLKNFSGFGKKSKNRLEPLFSNKSTLRLVILSVAILLAILFRTSISEHDFEWFLTIDPSMNPAGASKDFLTRILSLNYIAARHAWLLILPLKLSHNWQGASIPLVESFFDLRNLLTLSFYTLIFTWLRLSYTKKISEELRKAFRLSFLITAVSFLPSSNLFMKVGFVLAERVLYIPSMGFCAFFVLFLACFFGGSFEFKKLTYKHLSFILVLLSVLIFNIQKTTSRNSAWTDRFSLYKSSYEAAPRNALILYVLAQEYARRQDFVKAKYFVEEVLKVPPWLSPYKKDKILALKLKIEKDLQRKQF